MSGRENLQQLDAIEPRHDDVGDDRVGIGHLLAEQAQGLGAVGGLGDEKTFGLQNAGSEAADDGLVIHHEDPDRIRG